MQLKCHMLPLAAAGEVLKYERVSGISGCRFHHHHHHRSPVVTIIGRLMSSFSGNAGNQVIQDAAHVVKRRR